MSEEILINSEGSQKEEQMIRAVTAEEKLPFFDRIKSLESKASAMFISCLFFASGGISPFVGMLWGKIMTPFGHNITWQAILFRVLQSMLLGVIVGYILGRIVPVKGALRKLLGKKYTPKKYAFYLICIMSFLVVPICAFIGVTSNTLIPKEVKVQTTIMHIILDSTIAFVLLLATYKKIKKFICHKLKDETVI